MGGTGAAKGIRAQGSGAKVIVSSGYSGNSIMALTRNTAFALSKPYNMRELSTSIQLVQNETKQDSSDIVHRYMVGLSKEIIA